LVPFIQHVRGVAAPFPDRRNTYPDCFTITSGTEVARFCCVSGSHEGRATMMTHSLALRAGLFVAVHVGLLAGMLLLL
jgi:hypothetical protein